MLHYISLPFVFMREVPSIDGKVVSQAIFSEQIQHLKSENGWDLIQTPDGYSGWVMKGSFWTKKIYHYDIEVTSLIAHLYLQADIEFGPLLSLPFGSKLEQVEDCDSRWLKVRLPDETRAFIQKGDIVDESLDLCSFSKKFLFLPYTWGGRCSFGYDCSGFVQMLYSRLGISLPRDARMQVLLGNFVSLENLNLGDLIFWGFSEGDIRHVAMYLEGDKFIHSSAKCRPYIRIDSLSDKEWGNLGHYPFRTVRRIIDAS